MLRKPADQPDVLMSPASARGAVGEVVNLPEHLSPLTEDQVTAYGALVMTPETERQGQRGPVAGDLISQRGALWIYVGESEDGQQVELVGAGNQSAKKEVLDKQDFVRHLNPTYVFEVTLCQPSSLSEFENWLMRLPEACFSTSKAADINHILNQLKEKDKKLSKRGITTDNCDSKMIENAFILPALAPVAAVISNLLKRQLLELEGFCAQPDSRFNIKLANGKDYDFLTTDNPREVILYADNGMPIRPDEQSRITIETLFDRAHQIEAITPFQKIEQ